MVENNSYEEILQRVLDRVPDKFDKREGSVIFDAVAPACAEIAQLYIALNNMIDFTFADTAPREYLIRRAAERGLTVREATRAKAIGVFNIDISLGERFSSERFNWIAEERISTGRYHMTCETVGAEPNAETGTLIPILYIQGLETAKIESIAIPGEDEEDTEAFRQRYFESFNSQAFGGNRKDYYDKITAQAGVGGCKIYRATNEQGQSVGAHVLAVITDSSFGVPAGSVVSAVQQAMDPKGDQEGDGLAPIGHICHVKAATGVKVNINSNITYDSGFNYASLRSHIESAIDEYLLELNKSWDKSSGLVVRISNIESRILAIDGVTDISGTKLNGNSGNLILGKNEIAQRGVING